VKNSFLKTNGKGSKVFQPFDAVSQNFGNYVGAFYYLNLGIYLWVVILMKWLNLLTYLFFKKEQGHQSNIPSVLSDKFL